jgi:hypothetical protein
MIPLAVEKNTDSHVTPDESNFMRDRLPTIERLLERLQAKATELRKKPPTNG